MKGFSQNSALAAPKRPARSLMSRVVPGLTLIAALSIGAGASAAAQAQETMTLERIGAVRMAQPEERQQPRPSDRAPMLATSAPVTSLPPQGR